MRSPPGREYSCQCTCCSNVAVGSANIVMTVRCYPFKPSHTAAASVVQPTTDTTLHENAATSVSQSTTTSVFSHLATISITQSPTIYPRKRPVNIHLFRRLHFRVGRTCFCVNKWTNTWTYYNSYLIPAPRMYSVFPS
jgi:hypothetical protein